ncbi:hypothetical protein WA026_005524 [Henosepilachna vigintioctopunctata]|uniref:Fatty acid desaturase domain-containing protein n=1 Tax=Henosepilachna vigintioctopunctata TaxID=420089 RepID=A0AAW1U220_9CUCU
MMPPEFSKSPTMEMFETEKDVVQTPSVSKNTRNGQKSWKNLWYYFGEQDLKWFNIFLLFTIHGYVLYVLLVVHKFIGSLLIFHFFYTQFSGFGITGGAHRYYTHKAFKAKIPLRIIMMLGFTSTGQNSIFHWVRDHRVHHKFSDTDADPHNAARGFFFSHCGWLLMKKHPDVIEQGKKVDMTDVLEDPVVQFHEKYFVPLWLIFCHIIPIVTPWYFLNVDLLDCFNYQMVRWVFTVNVTWSVNSAAHLWGNRPYDKSIYPAENRLVSLLGFGEGWHNYHHTFPWDYKAAELSWWLNTTGIYLNFFRAVGWAYDLKTPSKELIERIVRKTGDGSHFRWGQEVLEEEEERVLLKEE